MNASPDRQHDDQQKECNDCCHRSFPPWLLPLRWSEYGWRDYSRAELLTFVALVEHALFDDLIGPQQDRLGDLQAQRLSGLQVDD